MKTKLDKLFVILGLITALNGQSSTANTQTNSETATPVSPEDLKRGLVLHFNFDTAPDRGKVPDLSGCGNDGQAVGVRWVADGHRGGAMQFGLTNCYITVSNNDSLSLTQGTLAVWIKTSYTDWIWRRIMDKGNSYNFALSMSGDYPKGNSWRRGMVTFEDGGGGGNVISRVRVDDGKWHHVVATFDGNNLQLYNDGHAVRAGKSPHKKPVDPSLNLTIGANHSTPDPNWGEVGASFNGQMDDVMIYSRSLSAKEVRALFESQAGVWVDLPSPAKPPTADRLKQLKELHDQGLINKEDYDKKVKEILDSL